MGNEISKRKLVKAIQERWGDFWVQNSTNNEQAFQDVKNLYMRGVLKLRKEERCDYRHSFKELPLGSVEPDSRVIFDGFRAKEYKTNHRLFHSDFNDFDTNEVAYYGFLRRIYEEENSFIFTVTETRSKIVLLESTRADETFEDHIIEDIIRRDISMSREDTDVKIEIRDPDRPVVAVDYRIYPEIKLLRYKG